MSFKIPLKVKNGGKVGENSQDEFKVHFKKKLDILKDIWLWKTIGKFPKRFYKTYYEIISAGFRTQFCCD